MSGDLVVMTWGGMRIPLRPHPADQGPALEDLELLVGRAERRAEQQWVHEHGRLPWPRRPVEQLFELPPAVRA